MQRVVVSVNNLNSEILQNFNCWINIRSIFNQLENLKEANFGMVFHKFEKNLSFIVAKKITNILFIQIIFDTQWRNYGNQH